jgi:small subunit ribosomal protein S17
MSEKRGLRKVRTGKVVSDKMDKTISVLVERKVIHPTYKKYHRISKKFMAHDPENSCHIGDVVSIIETRPLSKHKRWRLLAVIERAK